MFDLPIADDVLVAFNALMQVVNLAVLGYLVCLLRGVCTVTSERTACSYKEEVKQRDFQVWFDSRVTEMDRAFGQKRSSHWAVTRGRHLEAHPVCEVCGGKVNLEVHHVEPFHVDPDRELDPTNLITLCEAPGHNCHFVFGHLLSWRSHNPQIVQDAVSFRAKIDRRPGAVLVT